VLTGFDSAKEADLDNEKRPGQQGETKKTHSPRKPKSFDSSGAPIEGKEEVFGTVQIEVAKVPDRKEEPKAGAATSAGSAGSAGAGAGAGAGAAGSSAAAKAGAAAPAAGAGAAGSAASAKKPAAAAPAGAAAAAPKKA
jgi:hypothetical protein